MQSQELLTEASVRQRPNQSVRRQAAVSSQAAGAAGAVTSRLAKGLKRVHVDNTQESEGLGEEEEQEDVVPAIKKAFRKIPTEPHTSPYLILNEDNAFTNSRGMKCVHSISPGSVPMSRGARMDAVVVHEDEAELHSPLGDEDAPVSSSARGVTWRDLNERIRSNNRLKSNALSQLRADNDFFSNLLDNLAKNLDTREGIAAALDRMSKFFDDLGADHESLRAQAVQGLSMIFSHYGTDELRSLVNYSKFVANPQLLQTKQAWVLDVCDKLRDAFEMQKVSEVKDRVMALKRRLINLCLKHLSARRDEDQDEMRFGASNGQLLVASTFSERYRADSFFTRLIKAYLATAKEYYESSMDFVLQHRDEIEKLRFQRPLFSRRVVEGDQEFYLAMEDDEELDKDDGFDKYVSPYPHHAVAKGLGYGARDEQEEEEEGEGEEAEEDNEPQEDQGDGEEEEGEDL